MSIPTIQSIPHPDAPVEVWREDDLTDAPVVALEVGFPGKDWDAPVFIPVEIARQVAAAILATVPE